MKPKLFIIFSLIVVIPMTTIIWLGISLSKRERSVIKDQFSQILTADLNELKDQINKKIQSHEILFKDANKDINIGNVQDNLPADSIINQVFILDQERKLVYPSTSKKGLNKRETSFLSRTEEIWASKERFYRPTEWNYIAENPEIQSQVNSDNQQLFSNLQVENLEQNQVKQQIEQQNIQDAYSNKYAVQAQQAEQQSTSQNKSRNQKKTQTPQQVVILGNRRNSYISSLNDTPSVEATTGWYSWFQGPGLNFILWKRTEQDQIIGFELNRKEFIDSLVATLPESSNDNNRHFKLQSVTNELHSWGNFEPKAGQKPIAEVSLDAPIQSWKLQCYFNDSHLTLASSRTILYNYVLGGGILGILIGALCVYFYRENTRQLRESSQKVNFVNQVSHELKTPLTNIRMYAELLERNLDEANYKSQKQLGVIVSESQRLSRLIANVLSFAQKDKKTLKLNIRSIDTESLLKNLVNTYTPVLSRKNISIKLSINGSPKLQADSDALEQIIGNLLSNIEKYVQEGGETEIECIANSEQLFIKVTDNGPGIPAKQREKIFDSFHRVSNALSDGVSGTGIGLTISRDLARLHGGDLILLDTEVGASFQLTLPIKA